MSPELETLDQLLGGELPLAIIRPLYRTQEEFQQGIYGLLSAGDILLVAADAAPVPQWRWRKLLNPAATTDLESLKVQITDQGARMIK